MCGSIEEYDDCGICGGDGSDDLGCGCFEAGPSGCDNTCGSVATEDNCGTCDDNSANDCEQDCNAEWGGSNSLDMCGVCDDDSLNDCVQDCNGEWGGSAVVDDCGICSGGGSGHISNSDKDCNGVCFGSALVDSCGICAGGTTELIPDVDDVGCGCFNAEAMTYCYDLDSDGLGAGESTDYCLAQVPNSSWVSNCSDEEPTCSTNDTDECNECGGDNSSCSDCAGVPNGGSNIDMCGICDDISENDCIQDCVGVWGGTAVIDECGVCDGDGIIAGECDCFGNVLDNCGVCDGDNSSCTPPEFLYTQSSKQAFYYFNDAFDINNETLDSEDWIGAFNGDICIGAKKWDPSECGGLCSIPVMGDDGYEYSEGYIQEGQIPNFKIFDTSLGEYFDAVPSSDEAWEDLAVYMIDEISAEIYGCTDELDPNYNESATIEDGSCEFNQPEEFTFNISTLQAFYFFQDITDIYGEPLAPNDWVGAFKGDLCVGARQWDTNACQGGVCEVPIMGNDGSYYTEGYMITGEIPTFKIYDASENQVFYAVPSESVPWGNFSIPYIESMYASESYQVNLYLHPDNNLISFLTLPEDASVSAVLEPIAETANRVLTDGSSAFYGNGAWSGSLQYLDTYSGYWIRSNDFDTLTFVGGALDPYKSYDLEPGLNLISYSAPGFVSVGEGLPDDIEHSIEYIIGESEATYQLGDGNWVGSMDSFRGDKGYWFSSESALSFSYNAGEYSLMLREVSIEKPELPEEYKVYLSTAKAFYFIDISSLDQGGYLLSYCGNTLTGARQWNGEITDVPVMGVDSNEETAGFCSMNEIPRFEYVDHNGAVHKLHGDIQAYAPNGVQMVGAMDEIPVQFNMLKAYPNPFNPSTNISFELNHQSNVQLAVYDIKGAFVQEIENDVLGMGSYTYNWDASAYPSAVYMLRLTTNSQVLTQKVVLMK